MTATATATFTVTLTKREATFTLFTVPWKMANSRYFFFWCFSLVVPLPRVGIIFEPFPVSLFSAEAVQGFGIEEYAYCCTQNPTRFNSGIAQHPFQTTTPLHARLLSIGAVVHSYFTKFPFFYRDRHRRRGSHCHSDVDGTADSRWQQPYETCSVNSETWPYHRHRHHFRRSVNTA